MGNVDEAGKKRGTSFFSHGENGEIGNVQCESIMGKVERSET